MAPTLTFSVKWLYGVSSSLHKATRVVINIKTFDQQTLPHVERFNDAQYYQEFMRGECPTVE